MTTIQVEVRGGLLHPVDGLPPGCKEGERLDASLSHRPSLKHDPITLDESLERMRQSKTFQELFEAFDIPVIGENNEGYDLLRELNNNRLRAGGSPIIPAGTGEA